jgi:hypothetical protein
MQEKSAKVANFFGDGSVIRRLRHCERSEAIRSQCIQTWSFFRHCERSEAIHMRRSYGLPRRSAPRNDKEHTMSDLPPKVKCRSEMLKPSLSTVVVV